jgi:6,7-dimethyl-8-ribityllumazine synthase
MEVVLYLSVAITGGVRHDSRAAERTARRMSQTSLSVLMPINQAKLSAAGNTYLPEVAIKPLSPQNEICVIRRSFY